MKPSISGLILSLIILLSSGCRREINTDQRNFFDLEGFIDSQVLLLSEGNYELTKKTRIGDNMENLVLQPDSSGWQKELSIFKTADIDKPGLQEYYDKILLDSGNIEVENYTLNDSSVSETVFLRIERDKMSNRIRTIKAAQQSTNPIYYSKRKLFLLFYPINEGKIRLDSFAVKGFQKMVLQDSITYFTAGKINFQQ